MGITVPTSVVEKEIEELKIAHNIKYMTKEKCKKIAGWYWSRNIENRSKWAVMTGVYFTSAESETYYLLKWANYIV